MKSKEDRGIQLSNFIQKDKFSKEVWNDRGLLASETELSNLLNNTLNNCGQILIQLVNNDGTKKELKKALKIVFLKLKNVRLDTEEKAMVGDYLFELSEIVEVDFTNNLNQWLYGRFLSLIVRFLKK